MSTHADLMVARADYDRRLELAGVDPYDRHHAAQHRLGHHSPASSPGPATHPLAAFVARLVGGSGAARRGGSSRTAVVGSTRPRHP